MRGRRLPPALMFLMGAALLPGQASHDKIRAHLEQAEKATERGDFEAAASEYIEVVKLDPNRAEAHARLGIVYNRLGKLPESTESFERALRLDPKLPRLNVLLGLNYMAAGRCRDGVPLLSANFDVESQSSVRLVVGQRLLQCYFAAGDEEKAVGVVQKLRQIAPDDPDVLYAALKTYMSLWNGAFQRMMVKSPDSYRMRQVLAESLEAQERFAEAANEYRQILKMAPQLPGMHYQLGRMILRSDASPEGEQKALAEFHKELEIGPAAPALVEIGEIHLRSKQLAEASLDFSRAAQLQPEYVPARIGLAKLFIAEKQWGKALDQLEIVAKLAPDDEAVVYNLMLTYRGLGRTEDAKRAYDHFQRIKEQNQQARPPFLNSIGGAAAPTIQPQ